MKNKVTFVNSILHVKSVGVDTSKDLESTQTKSVAQLIEDEEKETEEQNQEDHR